jgi:hypothetical protein
VWREIKLTEDEGCSFSWISPCIRGTVQIEMLVNHFRSVPNAEAGVTL